MIKLSECKEKNGKKGNNIDKDNNKSNQKLKIKKTRQVYDYIHDFIELDDIYWQIIDTPQFQRLRDLYQNGSSHWVFPSAVHKRFEHCIGTGHLCNNLMKDLQSKQPELKISEQDIINVTVAGLCHDLGHGPFSHTFEYSLNNGLSPNDPKRFDHEEASIQLLAHLVKSNKIDISDLDLQFIQDLITGKGADKYNKDKRWMFQIVNNRVNCIDVDKFDYIKRDTYKFGIGLQGFNFRLLINNMRVIDYEICYKFKDRDHIYDLFRCRERLYKEFYHHRVTKGIDFMISDIFKSANSYFKFDEIVKDMDKYTKLTDNIISRIKNTDDPSLDEAKAIIKRIEKRDLYTFVGEYSYKDKKTSEEPKEKDILEFTDHIDIKKNNLPELTEKDIIVKKLTISWGMGDIDPVSKVTFYDNDYVTGHINIEDVSLINRTTVFTNSIIRVYVKKKIYLVYVKNAFDKLCKSKNKEVYPHSYEKSCPTKKNDFTDIKSSIQGRKLIFDENDKIN